MNTGVRLSRRLRLSFPVFRLFIFRAARQLQRRGLKARLRIAALRLSMPVLEFLLHCFCVLTPVDNSPGIPVSNIAELVREKSQVA